LARESTSQLHAFEDLSATQKIINEDLHTLYTTVVGYGVMVLKHCAPIFFKIESRLSTFHALIS